MNTLFFSSGQTFYRGSLIKLINPKEKQRINLRAHALKGTVNVVFYFPLQHPQSKYYVWVIFHFRKVILTFTMTLEKYSLPLPPAKIKLKCLFYIYSILHLHFTNVYSGDCKLSTIHSLSEWENIQSTSQGNWRTLARYLFGYLKLVGKAQLSFCSSWLCSCPFLFSILSSQPLPPCVLIFWFLSSLFQVHLFLNWLRTTPHFLDLLTSDHHLLFSRLPDWSTIPWLASRLTSLPSLSLGLEQLRQLQPQCFLLVSDFSKLEQCS